MTQVDLSVLDTLYRLHFASFVAKAFAVVHGNTRTFANAWHVEAMCEAMDEAVFGTNRRSSSACHPGTSRA